MVYKRKKARSVGTKRKRTQKKGSSLAGITKLKKIVQVARKLRKPGEKWTNAIKRASNQLRSA